MRFSRREKVSHFAITTVYGCRSPSLSDSSGIARPLRSSRSDRCGRETEDHSPFAAVLPGRRCRLSNALSGWRKPAPQHLSAVGLSRSRFVRQPVTTDGRGASTSNFTFGLCMLHPTSSILRLLGVTSMRLGSALLGLAGIFALCGGAVAEEASVHSPGKSGISKMFLDAHAPDLPPRYSRTEVNNMIRDARTLEDYTRLADYFDYQSLELQQKAQEQLKELERLAALPYHARTYPTQFASTQELMRRYRAQSHDYSARANVYRKHATAIDETERSNLLPVE